MIFLQKISEKKSFVEEDESFLIEKFDGKLVGKHVQFGWKKMKFFVERWNLQGKWYGSMNEKEFKKIMKKIIKFDSWTTRNGISDVN